MAGLKQEAGITADWDTYWRGTHENAAHREGGPQEVVLAEVWQRVFKHNLPGGDGERVLDLACGNGAVTGFAIQTSPQLVSYCLDSSVSAVLELKKRYPNSLCVAGDVLKTPFSSCSFDLVCSQFGVEYAGPESILEAARLVAPGGMLAAVLHLRSGAIYRECAQNLQVIDAIREINIFSLARAAFDAGFALNAGTGRVDIFKVAEKRFTPAVRGLESILHDMGSDAAEGLAQQLYRDISHMYRNMSAFDQGEVAAWLERMVNELDAYGGRMSSMLAAAIDQQSMDKTTEALAAQGFTIVEKKTLAMGNEARAAAWLLICQRSN